MVKTIKKLLFLCLVVSTCIQADGWLYRAYAGLSERIHKNYICTVIAAPKLDSQQNTIIIDQKIQENSAEHDTHTNELQKKYTNRLRKISENFSAVYKEYQEEYRKCLVDKTHALHRSIIDPQYLDYEREIQVIFSEPMKFDKPELFLAMINNDKMLRNLHDRLYKPRAIPRGARAVVQQEYQIFKDMSDAMEADTKELQEDYSRIENQLLQRKYDISQQYQSKQNTALDARLSEQKIKTAINDDPEYQLLNGAYKELKPIVDRYLHFEKLAQEAKRKIDVLKTGKNK